jgi:hypothetical protein
VPLIDSLACTTKIAELMVDPRRSTRTSHSRRGWFKAAPDPERAALVAGFYGMDRMGF